MFMGSNNIKFDIHIPTTYRNARVNQWADSHLHKRSEVERSERWMEAQRFT